MPPTPTYIDKLKEAIRATHGCEARHVDTVRVKNTFRGKTAWQGNVEIFGLIGHPSVKYCYAWAYDEGGTMRTTAVLGAPPVDSPETAVKAAIAAKATQ